MSKQEILSLSVKPEEVGPLLIALRPLVCVLCGVTFADHARLGKSNYHDFVELLEMEDGE